jgi:uncharacterized protein YjbJ (UPF0337 family)
VENKNRKDQDLQERGMKNQAQGKAEDVKGRVKDAAGGLTGDSEMQAEGKWDRAKGNVRDAAGDIQRRVGREQEESDRS